MKTVNNLFILLYLAWLIAASYWLVVSANGDWRWKASESCENLRWHAEATRCLAAIERVESWCDPNAVGDGGRAVGVLQIHPCTVEDANRIVGSRLFTCEDRWSMAKSREIWWTITNHYSWRQPMEIVARRWNGGPRGETKPATAAYWTKVRREMDRMEGRR